MGKKTTQNAWGACGTTRPAKRPLSWGVEVFRLRRKTSTPHANRVGGETASEQAVTLLRDTRALLLRSKKWTKSSFRRSQKNHKPHAKGEREGTWFPHAPAGDTHRGTQSPLSGVYQWGCEEPGSHALPAGCHPPRGLNLTCVEIFR